MSPSTCSDSCPEKYYIDKKLNETYPICSKCHPSCSKCSEEEKCISCIGDLYFIKKLGKCVKTCPNNLY
jgi:hypothetical protein